MRWFFRLATLQSDLRGLLARVKNLEEDLAALETKHERLRGRFYGSKRSPESDDQPTPRPETKAEILARMGYVRGGAVVPPKG